MTNNKTRKLICVCGEPSTGDEFASNCDCPCHQQPERECDCGYAQGRANYHAPDCKIFYSPQQPEKECLDCNATIDVPYTGICNRHTKERRKYCGWCDQRGGHLRGCPDNPEPSKSWELEFDSFVKSAYTLFLSETSERVKSFISKTLLSERTALVSEIEETAQKVCNGDDDCIDNFTELWQEIKTNLNKTK